ncbi:MAG: PEGA domain-containing protein [Methanoregula sp.]|nr:PEGA domain-containing protein [Methanoregula sp.]
MSNSPPLVTLALIVIVLAVASAGCSTSAPSPVSPGNGTLHVSSVPAGAEVYLDGQYRSPTPAVMYPVPAGQHTLEFRMNGYESVMYPVNVMKGGMEGIKVTLVNIQTILPATSSPTTSSGGRPHITVNGYWTYQPGKEKSTYQNEGKYSPDPIPLIMYIGATNDGTADAQKVTASANLYNEGRIVSQTPVDFGPLAAGKTVNRVIPVNRTISGGYVDVNLDILVENVTVTQ